MGGPLGLLACLALAPGGLWVLGHPLPCLGLAAGHRPDRRRHLRRAAALVGWGQWIGRSEPKHPVLPRATVGVARSMLNLHVLPCAMVGAGPFGAEAPRSLVGKVRAAPFDASRLPRAMAGAFSPVIGAKRRAVAFYTCLAVQEWSLLGPVRYRWASCLRVRASPC